MDKASGVYLKITDSSFQSSGTGVVDIIVPMTTVKGKIGINEVSGSNFRDIVGYDLNYNQNYLGLSRMLESVSTLKVWRINNGAKVANGYVASNGNTISTNATVTDPESIKTLNGAIVLGKKYAGNWGTFKMKLRPVETIISVDTTGASSLAVSLPFTPNTTVKDSTISPVSGSSQITPINGIHIYDSSDSYLVAVVDSASGNKIYNVERQSNGSYKYGTQCGTYSSGTLTFSSTVVNDAKVNIHTYPVAPTNLILTSWDVVDNVDTNLHEYMFSLDSDSDIYWRKVDFGDNLFYSTLTSFGVTDSYYKILMSDFDLQSGNNGTPSENITPGMIDLSVLDECGSNILITNGTIGTDSGYKFINRIIPSCEKNKIHIFADAPAYSKYTDVNSWKNNLQTSQYLAITARPDMAEVDGVTGKVIVYPSTKYAEIYSNMIASTQYLNYPPAGPTYGRATVEELMECDYELYKDQLKTNRINYLTRNSLGTMMWEQRTNYSQNSDFSYVAPVFIIDGLSQQIVEYEKNFNFRYMSDVDLSTQKSGLIQILDSYIDNGFIYSYSLKVPSAQEAQAAGRTLDIALKVQVMRDSEVINISIELVNTL